MYAVDGRYTGCPNKMLTPFDRLMLQLLKIKGTQKIEFKIVLGPISPLKCTQQ